MLADTTRNKAYRAAITAAVRARPGCSVLDIGGGSGLLSLIAVRAGATRVDCVEMNPILAATARATILSSLGVGEGRGGQEREVSVWNSFSTDLQVTQPGTLSIAPACTTPNSISSGLFHPTASYPSASPSNAVLSHLVSSYPAPSRRIPLLRIKHVPQTIPRGTPPNTLVSPHRPSAPPRLHPRIVSGHTLAHPIPRNPIPR